MLYYFKRLKVYYWLAAEIGLVVYICLFLNSLLQQQILPFGINTNQPLNTMVALILIILWGQFCILFFRYRARRLWVKMTNILLNDCDPSKFIETTLPLLKKQNPDINIHFEVCTTISSAYLAAGHYDDMKILLDSMSLIPFQTGRRARIYKIYYFGNLLAYYLNSNDMNECNNHLVLMEQVVSSVKGKEKALCQRFVEYNKCLFALKQGSTDGVEQRLQDIFRSAENELERVNAQYVLGGLYLHFEETQKAREAFEYVAQHGNMLAVAVEAREYLKS